ACANGRAVHPLKLGPHVRRQLAAHQELEVHLETGERRPKLVRGVGKKTLLQRARVAQMPEQSIECVDDGSDLSGELRLRDRSQVAWLATEKLGAHLRERTQSARDAKPRQRDRSGADQQRGNELGE